MAALGNESGAKREPAQKIRIRGEHRCGRDPASTTHRQLSAEGRAAAGAADNVVRLSIGIEDSADIIADLDQALAAASA